MARSISATLKTAQEVMGTPYIYLYFTSADGGTHYNYSSDQGRLLQLEHHEEAYNEYASILLRNEDRALPDLRGYWVEIGYGYVTGAGNEYKQTPRLWVKNQQTVSAMGVVSDILQLEGMWSKLRELPYRVGSPPYYDTTDESSTPYALMGNVLSEASMSLDALGSQDDSIINTFVPVFSINEMPFEYGAALIYRLIRMTRCYLRPETGLAWKVIYPQAADTTTIKFYSNKAPYFWEYVEKLNCLVPNHIIVFANAGTDGQWSSIITAESEDATEIARLYEAIKMHIASTITSQSDADQRAAAILQRVKGEQLAGRLLVPHDIRIEMHDKVTIYDVRMV